MGFLIICLGIFIIFSTLTYIIQELKGSSWKEKMLILLDHMIDMAWFQLNWTTLFMLIGFGLILLGIGMTMGFI
jgi:hypothetical protein